MLIVGVNTNAGISEADAYFDDRPRRGAAWLAASPQLKTEALLYATEALEQRAFKGRPLDPLQALHFPAEYYDVYGNLYRDIPEAIKHATFELALAHLEEDIAEAPSSGPGMSEVDIGPIKVRYQAGPDKVIKPSARSNPWVERLIGPFLRYQRGRLILG